jgi:hypothetical protein
VADPGAARGAPPAGAATSRGDWEARLRGLRPRDLTKSDLLAILEAIPQMSPAEQEAAADLFLQFIPERRPPGTYKGAPEDYSMFHPSLLEAGPLLSSDNSPGPAGQALLPAYLTRYWGKVSK